MTQRDLIMRREFVHPVQRDHVAEHGALTLYGQGVERDDAQALYWYTRAAEQGYAAAQYNLGWLYAKGQGVGHDVQQAMHWFSKAAEQGDAGAQNNLGMMYEHGKGVPQDFRLACTWYRRAAEWHSEPVIKAIYETLARDEARHGGAYLRYMKRALNNAGDEARAAFAKVGVLMASARRTAQALHPTNLHVNAGLFPRDTIQSRLPNPEWLEQWLDKQIQFDSVWENKVVERILRDLRVGVQRAHGGHHFSQAAGASGRARCGFFCRKCFMSEFRFCPMCAEPLGWLTAPPSETVDDRVREQRIAAALAQ